MAVYCHQLVGTAFSKFTPFKKLEKSICHHGAVELKIDCFVAAVHVDLFSSLFPYFFVFFYVGSRL